MKPPGSATICDRERAGRVGETVYSQRSEGRQLDWQIRKRSDSRSSGNSGWLLFAFVLLIVLISAALTVIPDLLWLAMRR